MAYQIAFDLYESATQHFLRRVQEEIRASLPSPPPPSTPSHNQGGEKLSVPVQETGGAGKSVEWGSDGVETLSVPVQETGKEKGGSGKGGKRKYRISLITSQEHTYLWVQYEGGNKTRVGSINFSLV